MERPENNIVKQKNERNNIFYLIFVKNIAVKLLGIVLGALYWVVRVGLSSGEFSGDFSAFGQLFVNNLAARFATPLDIVLSVLDILIVTQLFYLIMIGLIRVNISPVLKHIFVLLYFSAVVSSVIFRLPVMGTYADYIGFLLFLFLIILYNPEVKRYIQQASRRTIYESFSDDYDCSEEELRQSRDAIVKAVLNMSKNNVGALIVIANQEMPEHIIDSGIALNSDLSQPLIECIFNTKAYLHDGAVFIRANKIISAGCFLPLTQRDLPKELGTRHRAALGLGEQYDVLIIVVSEETGVISIVEQGEIERYCDSATLIDKIEMIYGIKEDTNKHKRKRMKSVR